jgi:glutathione S-transferase
MDRDFLCDGRFTIADIAIAYALYLGEFLGLSEYYTPQVTAYLTAMKARPAFQRAVLIGAESEVVAASPPPKLDLYTKT